MGAAGLAIGAGASVSADASERPNILLIVVDQMRSPCWFPEDARLPAFERLKKEGISFRNHYVCAVPCSPSRASLFTGLHLPQHGVNSNVAVNVMPGCDSLDPGIPTMGHLFRKAGYRTPYIGKWHLSTVEDLKGVGLSRYGFEGWKGPDHFGLPLEGLHFDSGFADQTVQWLESNGKNGPWFMTCSLINPHDIMYYSKIDVPTAFVPDICDKLPDNFNDSLENKPRAQAQWQQTWGKLWGMTPDRSERVWRQYIDFYYYLSQKVDVQIGKVLDALDRLGLEDTLVIFTSDHGEMAGSHRLPGKGPFVYEENNRVPLIMRRPGKIRPGSYTNALAQNVDVFPTMLELAGIKASVEHLPGKSLAPVIKDPKKTDLNDHVLMTFGYSVEEGKKATPKFMNLPPITAPMAVRGIYDGRYKYARYFDKDIKEQEFEFYDLSNDPLEMTNLAGDSGYRAKQKEMADKLREAEAKEMAPIER